MPPTLNISLTLFVIPLKKIGHHKFTMLLDSSVNKDKPARMKRESNGVGFVCANNSKYDIYWHMVFDVTMVSFWMTLLMNKFTNIFMDDG